MSLIRINTPVAVTVAGDVIKFGRVIEIRRRETVQTETIEYGVIFKDYLDTPVFFEETEVVMAPDIIGTFWSDFDKVIQRNPGLIWAHGVESDVTPIVASGVPVTESEATHP